MEMLRLIKSFLIYCFTIFLAVYVTIPFLVKTNPWILKEAVFLNRLVCPYHSFDEPQTYDLQTTRNLYTYNGELRIGIWHTFPLSDTPADINQVRNTITSDDEETKPRTGHKILYLHGNSGDRAAPHRRDLYKLLSQLGAHVIAPDYRGFGDSSGSPHTEDDVISDALAAFTWMTNDGFNAEDIVVWGHSLGTGIATKLLERLELSSIKPKGLILESPFTNLMDAAASHPISLPYRILPWFDWLFIEPLLETGIHMDSDKILPRLNIPTLILHAQDDNVVPFSLGKKLYEITSEKRPKSYAPVTFVEFESQHKYGHKYIVKAPELNSIIDDFFQSLSKSSKP